MHTSPPIPRREAVGAAAVPRFPHGEAAVVVVLVVADSRAAALAAAGEAVGERAFDF